VLETLLGEFGKEALDSVEPGSGCRGEVEDKPPMLFEPCHDVGMFVGGVVVDDDMDRLFPGHSGLDDVQKPNELLMATTALSLIRSARLNWIFVRSCMPQTRTRESFRESPSESKC